jgi:class 3 adenylate cyclase
MASFDSVSLAVECAAAIQRSLDDYNVQHPDEQLFLRIGISAGEPIEESGDLYGAAVNTAARLCAHSEPGQILVSDVVRSLSAEADCAFVGKGEITPRGFTEPIPIHEACWSADAD